MKSQANGECETGNMTTDALRQQTADKFREYGLLRKLGIVAEIKNPVVGVLTGKPAAAQFDVIRTCNIVVTTMASITYTPSSISRPIVSGTSTARSSSSRKKNISIGGIPIST